MTKRIKINPHFEEFIFDWKHKFYFLLGGYGSGKSYSVALKIILKLLEEQRTALVVRNVYDTQRESTFSLFKQIISLLELEKIIKINSSPMKIVFKNGSTIIFKGMDKPEKLKSINNISIIWAEEASEISYSGFKELMGRIRHPSLSLHLILSSNPVDVGNWVFKHFFEANGLHTRLYQLKTIKQNETFYHHSLAIQNVFLPHSYVEQLKDLKNFDTDLYRTAYLGEFGQNGVKVLPNFKVLKHEETMNLVNKCDLFRIGMDFGFEKSYNAVVKIAVDRTKQILFIYWEYYKNHLTDKQLSKELLELKQFTIYADSAEPKTIAYFNHEGFKMIGAKKFPGSRLANVKKLRRFKQIICSDNCTMAVKELSDLVFQKDKNDNLIYDFFNIDPHTLSAIWYALDGYDVADIKVRGNFSAKMGSY